MAQGQDRRLLFRRRRMSTMSRHEVAFRARYLELVFDNLVQSAPGNPLWCKHGMKSFKRAFEHRRVQVWAGPAPASAFLASVSDNLRDEALWNVARAVDEMYSTRSFETSAEEPIVVPDDRYYIHRGAAALPAPRARSALTSGTWDRILGDLAESVYLDVLLWAVQATSPELTVGDLANRFADGLKHVTRSRRTGGSEAEWEEQWRGYRHYLPPALEARVEELVAELTIGALDSFVGEVMRCAPEAVVPARYADVRAYRRQVVGNALAGVLESLPAEPELDDPFTPYLVFVERRRPLETAATDQVEEVLGGAAFDIVLPVRVLVAVPVQFSTLGFELVGEASDLPRRRSEEGLVYARFNGLQATSPEHAAEQARSRLRLALALGSLGAGGAVPFEILDAWVRYSNSGFWGFIGRRSSRALGSLEQTAFLGVSDLASLLTAGDDLAIRFQEATVHLHRAELAVDAEERFNKAWTVLEVMTGKASTRGADIICYLPFVRLPKEFSEMTGSERHAFIRSEYRRHLEQYEQMKAVRNENVVHRNLPRGDWQVLEQHAAAALSFARDAVSVGISAWRSASAAREPHGMVEWLQRAFKERFRLILPRKSDLIPD